MSASPLALHRTGRALLAAMLDAVESARSEVRFEFYIVTDSDVGRRFRDALARAAARGVRVRALADAWGSGRLLRDAPDFFAPLQRAGGAFRWFNPGHWLSRPFRDHRKLLVCDGAAFVGGCNLAPEYDGDGVTDGWRDLGVALRDAAVVRALERAFDAQWRLAGGDLRALDRPGPVMACGPRFTLLLTRPGFGRNPVQTALSRDLAVAREVRIVSAYFLPSGRLRRRFQAAARRGARVELLLAGRSDVALSQWASRSLYRRLLRSGVRLHEYEPQVLHAKLMVLDDAVYVGSSNLDPRSLRLNFEVMVRIHDPALATEARELFDADVARSRTWSADAWSRNRSWRTRLLQRLAHFLLARVDVDWTLSRLRRLRVRWRRVRG